MFVCKFSSKFRSLSIDLSFGFLIFFFFFSFFHFFIFLWKFDILKKFFSNNKSGDEYKAFFLPYRHLFQVFISYLSDLNIIYFNQPVAFQINKLIHHISKESKEVKALFFFPNFLFLLF